MPRQPRDPRDGSDSFTDILRALGVSDQEIVEKLTEQAEQDPQLQEALIQASEAPKTVRSEELFAAIASFITEMDIDNLPVELKRKFKEVRKKQSATTSSREETLGDQAPSVAAEKDNVISLNQKDDPSDTPPTPSPFR